MRFIVLSLLLVASLFSFDIKSASEKDWISVKGVGKVLAKRIVEYRNKYGLKSIDDLIKVKGIGKKKLQQIKQALGETSKTSSKKVDLKKRSNKPRAKIDLSKYDKK